MAARVLDRETMLDLFVNAVPLAIILLFALVGLVVAPIGWGPPFLEAVELGLLVVPFVVLVLVSVVAGLAVARDEERVEQAERAGAETDREPTVTKDIEDDEQSPIERAGTSPDVEGTASAPDQEPPSDAERMETEREP